jgi:hypothetical protein
MSDEVAALATREGWRSEGGAARVHYQGATDTYSIEYYAATETVLYWLVEDDLAVPVDRDSVPEPLRQRIRQDLDAAGVDPAAESQSV